MAQEQGQDLQPISSDQARELLYSAVRERLGEDWDDEQEGWSVITGHDYMLRLNKGRKNVDFYVDLLGNVTIEEDEITGAQENGRLYAVLFIGGSLFIAFVIARIAGQL